jgi:hypothetical protein
MWFAVDVPVHYLVPGQVAIATRSAIPRALEEGIPVWRLPRAVAHEASAEVLRALAAVVAALPQQTTEATLCTRT